MVADQGRGIGVGLVQDAILRTAASSDLAGVRALLAHATDDVQTACGGCG